MRQTVKAIGSTELLYFYPTHCMTNDSALQEVKKEGKQENREGWKKESAGQAKKWTGVVTGDAEKEAEGQDEQMKGNSMKHEGKAVVHMADAGKEMNKAAAAV